MIKYGEFNELWRDLKEGKGKAYLFVVLLFLALMWVLFSFFWRSKKEGSQLEAKFTDGDVVTGYIGTYAKVEANAPCSIAATGGNNNVDCSDKELAQFIVKSKELRPTANGYYEVEFKIATDKDTNIPTHLCVEVDTDVEVSSGIDSVNMLSNDGFGVSEVRNIGSNRPCLDHPATSTKAIFGLLGKPTYYNIKLDSY